MFLKYDLISSRGVSVRNGIARLFSQKGPMYKNLFVIEIAKRRRVLFLQNLEGPWPPLTSDLRPLPPFPPPVQYCK